MNPTPIETLLAARKIANYVEKEGTDLQQKRQERKTCRHMGAVLADSVLQAGLNYRTVVQPRVENIIKTFPEMDRTSTLIKVIERKETQTFLNWTHHQKIERFELLVHFLFRKNIESIEDLRASILSDSFSSDLQKINGIGPKTVDYMACLIGVDSIAVDRHIKAFAKRLDIGSEEYNFLRKTFCCAADLLSIPRRELDHWIWQRESMRRNRQGEFAL